MCDILMKKIKKGKFRGNLMDLYYFPWRHWLWSILFLKIYESAANFLLETSSSPVKFWWIGSHFSRDCDMDIDEFDGMRLDFEEFDI